MEIDLNCVESENGCCPSSICLVLWHACAGPLTSLPKKGNVVVYFPQGHIEQALTASHLDEQQVQIPSFHLPPQVFCRVLNVNLHAEPETDEVYAQVTLVPEPEPETESEPAEKSLVEEEEGINLLHKSTPHMFCKTLTASDTSTHGGFSVPRRAAEDCFPPLDYSQQRPSQELVAKDLHGIEWKFRHIYRGQPRRHLLTTGWSLFVNQRNLVSGDAVLFLRGDDGELRLGIRRASHPRSIIPTHSVLSGQWGSQLSVLSAAANAISSKSMFHIFYNPRASPSEFVIPYRKYVRCINRPVCVGMRFKMRFEMEDAAERRCSGVITGIGDIDPLRWPDSKWRCLMVRWDEDIGDEHRVRVSPWEIEPSVLPPALNVPRLKKLRPSLPSGAADVVAVSTGGGLLEVRESVRSRKVLQGQEDAGSKTYYYANLRMGPGSHDPTVLGSARMGTNALTGRASDNISIGFGEFHKVLQGQEIFPLKAQCDVPVSGNRSRENNGLRLEFFTGYQRPETVRTEVIDNSTHYQSNLRFYGASNAYFRSNQLPYDVHNLPIINGLYERQNSWKPELVGSSQQTMQVTEGSHSSQEDEVLNHLLPSASVRKMNYQDETLARTNCKLFGYSLTEDNFLSNASKRSCTKIFNMEGLLHDPEKGWRVVYTDNENDMVLVGDDPWQEFCDVVCKILICTQDDVENMSPSMLVNDDAQSCWEEAPVVIELSKSCSSLGPPQDSSPTITRGLE
ncbi:auxin response factor 4 isoform X2 [Amborella trichopoda]|uniref:auxin response factor 4 isoform X2 n=1 Tax=Amborella trichopoda TaxID=13333 RepID=UPI0009BCF8DD|nr:auxin response factor 4 isoform X2 [Amborella trichopoda]|eukprot:XP_020526713.1 auxin response factor 4 isoform X2 [Amborella trichopoda]